MDERNCTSKLARFRQRLYQNFNKRADTLMELVDALSSNPSARSPVELSLTPCFRRSHTALYKALAEWRWSAGHLAQLLAPHLPRPRSRHYWLLGVDVTPHPRRFAATLADRGMVYQPKSIKGNKPVTLGHQYSTVAQLPERDGAANAAWVAQPRLDGVPLATRRVRTDADKELVGAAQIDALVGDEQLPFRDSLCVEVGDTSYSKPAYLHAHRKHPGLLTLTRVRNNRNFYRQPERHARGAGHPRWFGECFALQDPQSWHAPDEQLTSTHVSQRGREYRVEIWAWHNMLMRGKRTPELLPMHRYPFTLVRIVLYDQNGKPAFRKPLWLIVVGERRRALSLLDIYQAYRQRAGLEHFFRFGKQKLLADKFQTPDVEREEAWWHLVLHAYAQLWLARDVAEALPRPWERHLPSYRLRHLSPALVQRDFGRIIRQLGTPARAPRPRGYSPGRARGTRLPPRPRLKVIVRSQMAQQPP